MRVFISADIEGVTSTTLWDQTNILENPGIAGPHADQMTKEVKAACEGAIEAGADYILVKDAHGSGVNIDITQLPECVEVIRNWSGHPYSMAFGIDSSFDAAMFVGYHSAAGRDGNPLSHTMTKSTIWTKLNGIKCSEFIIYSYVAAMEGVPTVLLTGDKMLCEDSVGYHPLLQTVVVKDGYGAATKAINPTLACKKIKEAAYKALSQDLKGKNNLCKLPSKYVFELCYKEHTKATAMSYYPGFIKTDDNVIRMETENFMDILTATRFIM